MQGTVSSVSQSQVTGQSTTNGGLPCGSGAGQVLTDGSMCVLSDDALVAGDVNDRRDGFLLDPIA